MSCYCKWQKLMHLLHLLSAIFVPKLRQALQLLGISFEVVAVAVVANCEHTDPTREPTKRVCEQDRDKETESEWE